MGRKVEYSKKLPEGHPFKEVLLIERVPRQDLNPWPICRSDKRSSALITTPRGTPPYRRVHVSEFEDKLAVLPAKEHVTWLGHFDWQFTLDFVRQRGGARYSLRRWPEVSV